MDLQSEQDECCVFDTPTVEDDGSCCLIATDDDGTGIEQTQEEKDAAIVVQGRAYWKGKGQARMDEFRAAYQRHYNTDFDPCTC